MKLYLSLFIAGILGISISGTALAQHNQVVHLSNNGYIYIKNLQQRGFLPELNPTALPYTRAEIEYALQNVEEGELSTTEHFWYSQIQKEWGIKKPDNEDIYVFGMIEGGFDLNNTINDEGIRPQANELYFLPLGASNLYAEKGDFSAQLGLRHNLFYHYDRWGEYAFSRYYVRSEDFYLGYQNDFLKLYAGRYDNHWGIYEEASTVLSTNPRSFDHLSISAGPSWFKISGIFAELDNLGKDGTFNRGHKNLIDGTKRFLALHRIDIKITDGLRIGYFDGYIYSSQNSISSLKYMNPANFLFFDRNINPLNDEFNYLFGGLIWYNHRNVTTNLQVMLDDLQVARHLSNIVEPVTFSVTHSLNVSGITDWMDAGYEAEAVAYQTYNTDQAEGRYLFLRRGLATQFNDYIYLSGYLKLHAHKLLRGLTITPRISYLAQGEQEIDQPFVREYENGEVIDVILSGTEEKTSRFSLNLFYNPIPELWVKSELGYNYLNNKNHISGQTDSRFTARLEAGFRLRLDNYTFDELFRR